MEKEIVFINNSWRFLKRSVNLNIMISYTQEGGFRSRKEAEDAKEISDAQYEFDLKRIKKIANIQYTFKEYIEYWLTDIFIESTSTSTKTIGLWAVRNLIIPNIEQDILLNYITADYINDIIVSCIPICDSAGETAVKFLRKMLKDAYAYRLIPRDIRDDLMNVKRSVPKIKLLPKAELKKLINEASKHPGYYFEILLGLFAGLRTGEIRGLRYDDFDPEKHTIRISRQYTTNYQLADNNGDYSYSYYMEEKDPKAGSFRLLHVPGFLFDELEKKRAFNEKIIQNRLAQGQQDLDSEYVALSPSGKRNKKTSLWNALKRTCNYAGIPQISFHALRHQFATMLIEKGIPLEDISKLLGHKSVLTTFNIYCGVMDADDDVRSVMVHSNFLILIFHLRQYM